MIVVDDGGAAPAAPVAAGFQDRLRLRNVRQWNQGPAAARNTGARVASGRILCFTDDDCEPEPEWLSAMHRALDHNPGAMAGGRTVNSLAGEPCPEASQWIHEFVYAHYNRDPRGARFFASNNMAMAAEGFHELGGFDRAFRNSEDRDLCDRWICSGRRMIYLPEAVVGHAHRMNLRGYWQQHVGYGRGARRFMSAHRRRNPRAPRIEGSFYAGLLRELPRTLRGGSKPWQTAFLLALWQAANLWGFALETVRPLQARAAAARETA